MNYIKHLNAVFNHMDQNPALSAQHISLYLPYFGAGIGIFSRIP